MIPPYTAEGDNSVLPPLETDSSVKRVGLVQLLMDTQSPTPMEVEVRYESPGWSQVFSSWSQQGPKLETPSPTKAMKKKLKVVNRANKMNSIELEEEGDKTYISYEERHEEPESREASLWGVIGQREVVGQKMEEEPRRKLLLDDETAQPAVMEEEVSQERETNSSVHVYEESRSEPTMLGFKFGFKGRKIKPARLIRTESDEQMAAEFRKLIRIIGTRHNHKERDQEYLWQMGESIQKWNCLPAALAYNFGVFIKNVRVYRQVFAQFISNEEFLDQIVKQEKVCAKRDTDRVSSPPSKAEQAKSPEVRDYERMKGVFDEVQIMCVAEYEARQREEDSVDLASEVEDNRFVEYLPEARDLGHMVGGIVKASNLKMEEDSPEESGVNGHHLVARDPALVADLKKATRDFHVCRSISSIFSHKQALISCLDYDNSIGLRSGRRVVEISREEFEGSREQGKSKGQKSVSSKAALPT